MQNPIDWKIGVEIELLAPAGSSRVELARACAERHGGSVRTVLHQDSEPSKVPGKPLFYNLTQGFEALDRSGGLVVRCVDDLTLQDDLDRNAVPKSGWWRVVSDDDRLLRMLALHIDASAPLPDALERLPALFDGKLIAAEGGMYRLVDSVGAPLAIAAPLPGERERGCELISPPIDRDHYRQIDQLLTVATELGFALPQEGATHIHFDGQALINANSVANLVNCFSRWADTLRALCATPSRFRRVGGWPPELAECANAPGFRELDWEQAQQRLALLGLSKYCDFNLKNLIHPRDDLLTFEVRILPAYTTAKPVVMAAELFAAVLRHCCSDQQIESSSVKPYAAVESAAMLATLDLSAAGQAYWQARSEA